MSVSAKLTDYDETRELLGRLKVRELKRLARQNGVVLEKEDISGNVKLAKTKEEVIDVLVDSDFKDSSLVELLGLSRLTKEELLNQMKTRQLKRLAKETGVLLEKTTFLGIKKASKKRDVVDVLKVLSPSKIRDYAKKISLIKKPVKKVRKRKKKKTTAKKPSREALKKKKVKKRAKQPTRPLMEKPARKEPEKIIEVRPAAKRKTKKEAGIIEEAIRERIIERKIIRRRVGSGVSDAEAEIIEKIKPEKIKVKIKKTKKK